jgi:hypothetical protein
MGICADKDNAVWVTNDVSTGTVKKIVNGIVTATIAVGANPYMFGDATGMQWDMLFNSSVIPSNMCQAMTGGV